MGFRNSSLSEIGKHIDENLDKIIASGVSEDELIKAKNKLENNLVNHKQTTLGIADRLAYFRTFYNNTNMINSEQSRYQNVSINDVKEAAQKYLSKNNQVVLHYLPVNKPNAGVN